MFANFDTMFKNWFDHKIQTVSDMSKFFFSKLLLGFIRVSYINLDKIWGVYCKALFDSYKKCLFNANHLLVHICALFVCRCYRDQLQIQPPIP